MRSMSVSLAVALMGTTALAGGTGHLTMTVGGSSTYLPAPGETFRVDVTITAASVPMVAFGLEPVDEANAGYTVVASVLGGAYGDIVLNYADAGPPYRNTSGWSVHADYTTKQWPAGNINALNLGPYNYAFRPGAICLRPPEGTGYAIAGWACCFMLTAPATGPLATRIVVEDVYAGDATDPLYLPLAMTYTPLVLLPEPASALFLLAGLPLLRRRR